MWQNNRTNLLIAGIAFMLLIFGSYRYITSDIALPKQSISVVEKRDFSLQVIERGIIKPARVVPIKSLLSSNQAKIIWMEKEGKTIHSGDLIAQFDPQPFNDKFDISKQDLSDAQLRLGHIEKSIALKQEEIHEQLEESKRNQEMAKIESDDLRHGSGKLERKKILKQLKLSRWKHNLTKEKYDAFLLLFEKGHLSKRELEVSSNNYHIAVDDLKISTSALNNFDLYEWPRLIRKSDMLLESAKRDLERIKRTSELELAKLNEDLQKQHRDVASYQVKLRQAQKDIGHCKVRAPANGILLYADIPTSNGKRKVHIGDAVWVGQVFMTIPDTEDLITEIKVREIDVAKLSEGLDATLRIDAFSEEVLLGKVVKLSSLAKKDEENPFSRIFLAEIELLDAPTFVHVGMSATVTIDYKKIHNTLSIPTNAIGYYDGKPVVKMVAEGADDRFVTLGIVGHEWAEVVNGLTEGENIVVKGL